MNPVPLDGKKMLVIAYGHLADTMAAIPALRSLRARYPSAVIHVLALESAKPVLGPCPYVDRVITWRDFGHKSGTFSKLEKLGTVTSMAARLRPSRYDATIVLHRSSGAMRKLSWLIGSEVRAGSSPGGGDYTHLAFPTTEVESSRDENRRVLHALGVEDDGGPLELWTSTEDARWAAGFLGTHAGPKVGLHPGSDWSCQQWLPDRFAAVGAALQAELDARIVITGSAAETELETEVARGLNDPLRACGLTSFGQFVEVIRRLDVLVCVNSAAAAVARAVGTPAVVLLGYEDARHTGLATTARQILIQPEVGRRAGGWCEFGRWGVLSGCDSPMCRGLGGLGALAPGTVTEAAVRLLQQPARATSSQPTSKVVHVGQ